MPYDRQLIYSLCKLFVKLWGELSLLSPLHKTGFDDPTGIILPKLFDSFYIWLSPDHSHSLPTSLLRLVLNGIITLTGLRLAALLRDFFRRLLQNLTEVIWLEHLGKILPELQVPPCNPVLSCSVTLKSEVGLNRFNVFCYFGVTFFKHCFYDKMLHIVIVIIK